jgi:hypothetical protein
VKRRREGEDRRASGGNDTFVRKLERERERERELRWRGNENFNPLQPVFKQKEKNGKKEKRKMIEIQYFYNKCTTALSHGVDSTHCGTHPI